ncbi:ribonuclease H-like domain-containing protein, partial [Tanacetum coccineum]
EMDLKWQMVMLTMRAKRFLNKTGRKISTNGSETIRALRENMNREPIRRNVIVETTETKALVAQDRLGYDWSDQAKEGPTNFALMAYTSSGSSSSSSSDSEELIKSVEARLDMYKKNEVIFEEDIKILKHYIMLRDNALTELRKKFEKAKKERDDLKLTLEKFENSSKNLRKLLEIQVNDKYKTSEGYHVVPPPYTGNFMPSKPNLVLADKEEYVFSESITSVPIVETSKVKTSESKPKSIGEPLIEDWIFKSEDENETKFKSKQRKPSFDKVEFVKSNKHVKIPRESIDKSSTVHAADNPDKRQQHNTTHISTTTDVADPPPLNIHSTHLTLTQVPTVTAPENINQDENETEFKSKQRKPSFAKIEFVKSNEHVKTPKESVKKKGKSSKFSKNDSPSSKRNFVPKAVLMKSGIKTLNTVGQNFSKAAVSVNIARPINIVYPRPTVNSVRTSSNVFNRAHTHVRRPFNKSTTDKSSNLKEKVNTVKGNVTIVGPKAVVSDNKGNEANAVKALACWVWRPNQKVLDHVFRHNGASMNFKRFDYVDAQGRSNGCSRDMTGNKSYLSDYEEINGGFVAFRGNPKGGRITGKGKISTGRKPALSFMRPFGCPVTILNTLDHLGNQTNGSAGTKESINAGQADKKIVSSQEYILLPLLTNPSLSKGLKDSPDAGFKPSGEEEKKDDEDPVNEEETRVNQEKDASVNRTNSINTVSSTVNVVGIEDNVVDENIVYGCEDDPNMPNLEEIVYSEDDEGVGVEADMSNLNTFMPVSPIPTTRLHKDHPLEQIIGDIHSAPQTRRMTKSVTEHDPSWMEAMQEELLQFKLQQVWTLVDLPHGKRAIGTKWVYRNKKDERGNVIRNKARMVAQGYTQEERIYNTPILINIAAEANLGYYFIVKQS